MWLNIGYFANENITYKFRAELLCISHGGASFLNESVISVNQLGEPMIQWLIHKRAIYLIPE